jgi:hypothetical protein
MSLADSITEFLGILPGQTSGTARRSSARLMVCANGSQVRARAPGRLLRTRSALLPSTPQGTATSAAVPLSNRPSCSQRPVSPVLHGWRVPGAGGATCAPPRRAGRLEPGGPPRAADSDRRNYLLPDELELLPRWQDPKGLAAGRAQGPNMPLFVLLGDGQCSSLSERALDVCRCQAVSLRMKWSRYGPLALADPLAGIEPGSPVGGD